MKGLLWIIAVGLISPGSGFEFPSCWRKYGECLDNNGAKLKLDPPEKAEDNENIVDVKQNIYTLAQCLRECEQHERCNYFTLYRPDENKDCNLIGFQLGTTCNRLKNTCVLYHSCENLNGTCGVACEVGRRLIYDERAVWYTAVIGGVREERDQFESSVEIYNEEGLLCNKQENITYLGEGMAAAYDYNTGYIIACGGFNGSYLVDCEFQENEKNWTIPSTAKLNTARAFHTMLAGNQFIYTFGGYNDNDGFLDTIEIFDETSNAWTASATTLPSKRSHMCGVTIKMNGTYNIFLLGGWDENVVYLDTILQFTINNDGTLTKVRDDWTLPEDTFGTSSTRNKSDMACMHYRYKGWDDGIMITGGYRGDSGWINKAWILNITKSEEDGKSDWTEIRSIHPDFEKGRHYHGMGLANTMPFIVGGWRNMPLKEALRFEDCTIDEEETGIGEWKKMESLEVAREKAVVFPIKRDHLPTYWKECTKISTP